MEHFNGDLKNIITPVQAEVFGELLHKSGYDAGKTNYLVKGFKKGFSLKFKGNRIVKRTAPNLKIRIGSKEEIWNKIMTEVKAGRYAGPFEEPPFEHFIQSPIGLVPKDKGKKTRLIFHLSYPRNGNSESVNAGIPREHCTVKYPDFTDAVEMCIHAGMNCTCAKSDMSMAFRHVPLRKKDWSLLILKAEHPETGKTFFFVDKCLPFGAGISCKIFQEISNGIAHIVKYYNKKPLVNYLDDYFFADVKKLWCDEQVKTFLKICNMIQFPVAIEKTYWGTTILTFLGLLLDTTQGLVGIPTEKIERALDMIEYFLNKNKKKATVKEIQKLAGYLNFLCRCVIPGRAFTRRFYASTKVI